MGHTLVTAFEDSFYHKLKTIFLDKAANKIPFGRKCDREAADQVLDYHATLVHWAKGDDALFLPRVSAINFTKCSLIVTGSCIMDAEEGSKLLYFELKPGDGFEELAENIYSVMKLPVSYFLHITLAVSQNDVYINKLKEKLDQQCTYPFEVQVTGLDLYHIWKPVELVKRMR